MLYFGGGTGFVTLEIFGKRGCWLGCTIDGSRLHRHHTVRYERHTAVTMLRIDTVLKIQNDQVLEIRFIKQRNWKIRSLYEQGWMSLSS